MTPLETFLVKLKLEIPELLLEIFSPGSLHLERVKITLLPRSFIIFYLFFLLAIFLTHIYIVVHKIKYLRKNT